MGIGKLGGDALRSRRRANQARTGAESVTLGISIVLLAAIVGGLIWLELTRGDSPARVAVTPHFDAVYSSKDGDWYLPVTIENVGDRTTDALHVNLERDIPGEQPEVAELEYTFVAGGEQVTGAAVFQDEPTQENVSVDVVSVTDP